MSDWQVGDLAVCVRRGSWRAAGYGYSKTGGPQKNGVYRVDAVEPGYLGFAEWSEGLWEASCFRRIRPDEHKGESEDWQLLLDSMKRKVRA